MRISKIEGERGPIAGRRRGCVSRDALPGVSVARRRRGFGLRIAFGRLFSAWTGVPDAGAWPGRASYVRRPGPGDPAQTGGLPIFNIGANLSNAQCRGVSFALEAADLPDAYPRPISAASHVKDARDTDKCPRWQCLVINRRCRKTHF